MNVNQPTELEIRIAESDRAARPATAEEIRLAGLSGKDLMAAKTGAVKEAADPNAALKRQLGRYAALTRPKMSPTKVYNCRIELEKGADPLLLAIHYNADFSAVMRIANDVLRVRCEKENRDVIQFPTDIPGYIKIAFAHQAHLDAQNAACNPPAAESDLAQKDTARHA